MSTSGKIGVHGLKTSGNRLTQAPGALTQATNCVIPSKDMVSVRRGQMMQSEYAASTNGYIDGDATDANNNRATELYQWGSALLVNYTGSGGYKLASFAAFATAPSRALVGSYAPPEPTVTRMKFAQLAKSLYWTTDAGLYTLDAVGGTARSAGVRSSTAIWIGDGDGGSMTRLAGNVNATGAWFEKDQTVGYRCVIGKKDANGVIHLSSATGRVVVQNPADLTIAIGALVLAGNVVTATAVYPPGHKFRVGDKLSLTLTGADIGNFTVTDNVVTAVTQTTITWADPKGNYVNVATVAVTSGAKSVQVVAAIPSTTTAGDFLQVYRTDEAAGEAIDPGDECYLAYERTLTAQDVSFGYATVQDTTPSGFLGDPLDSNSNSGEGVFGIDMRPPLCRDICAWDNRLWGGQTTDRHRLRLRLLGVGSGALSGGGLQASDTIAINTRVMLAGANFEAVAQYLPTENVERTCASMALNMNVDLVGLDATTQSDGDTGLGLVMLEQTTLGSTFAEGAGGAISAIYAATSRTTAWGDALATIKTVTQASTSRTGSTVTARCTGHGFAQGQVVMLAYRYSSALDANFPVGLKTVATVVDADNFTYTEAGSAVTLAGGSLYYAYATTYKSDNNAQPVRFSRAGIPEAWPIVNTLGGFPDGTEVLRIAPSGSGYSLMIHLTNGAIYRVSGEYPYVVRRLDDTASLICADTLQPHSGKLTALTTQGLVTITEGGVGIIGADVEDYTRAVVNNLKAQFVDSSVPFAVSYESERQYMLAGPSAGNAAVNDALVYQSFVGEFTRESLTRTCGLVFRGPDLLVMGDLASNQLRIERKALTHNDYADGLQALVANGTQTNVSTVVHDAIAVQLPVGSVAVIGGTNYRVTASDTTSITIDGAVSVADNDAMSGYRAYSVTFTFAPDAGGAPGIEKRWREIQLHFGANLIEKLALTFTTEHGATGSVTSTAPTADFSIGGTPLVTTVRRVAVPKECQMCTTLTVSVTLTEAWSYFDLYGISATSEKVSERTGKP